MKVRNIEQPRQRLPYSKKTKEWRKSNIDYADTHSFYYSEEVRRSFRNKLTNLNLYNGIVDIRDLTNVSNPFNIDASFVPDNIPHIPILAPKIDLLVGEEIKRRFDFYCMVTNPEAISKKEADKVKVVFEKLQGFLSENYTDEELKQKLEELNRFLKYTWQDLRERMANQILKHYFQELDLKNKFNKAFKNALIMADTAVLLDIVHDEPVCELLNTLKVYPFLMGNSDRYEDADMIIIEDYKSPSRLIDDYHDELKPEDIDCIKSYSNRSGNGGYTDDLDNHTLLRDTRAIKGLYDSVFETAESLGFQAGSDYVDQNGNIRELKVRWKSLKLIKKIKFYDEFGDEQYRLESEEYKPNYDLGEECTNLWVNEAWEGTLIGNDIYVNMRPMKVQYSKLNNPSKCHLGIIGQIYNTNQGKAVSFVDRTKILQYEYDVLFDRLNKAIATNYGKLLELDIAKVPANWEIDKWLHFAVTNKIAIVDSFKEGTQGRSTGTLAGNMNTMGGRSIDMETGNYIQQHIALLEYIKSELGEICGVTRQREGQISNRETVGGVERSVNQSSHVTEFWFAMHDSFKLRVLEALLETAKIALKSKGNKKVQNILDDLSIEVLNLDTEELAETDYGIVMTNVPKAMELEQTIKSYAQAFVQNGGPISSVIDIHFSSSIMDMKRKLEEAEELMYQRNAEASKQANELEKQRLEREYGLKESELLLKDIISQREIDKDIYLKEMELSSQDNSIEEKKLDLEKDKVKKDFLLRSKELNDKMEMHLKEMEVKKQDNRLKRSKSN